LVNLILNVYLGKMMKPSEYEKTQKSHALLKILALSNKNLKDGNVKSIDQTFIYIRKRINEDNK
jgi:hypothetical protein